MTTERTRFRPMNMEVLTSLPHTGYPLLSMNLRNAEDFTNTQAIV